jgi:hypothetical protein
MAAADGDYPGAEEDDRKPSTYRYLPAECSVRTRTVLIAENSYFRLILENVAPDLGDPVESREETI